MVQLEESWKAALAEEFDNPNMVALKAFLASECSAGKRIYPKGSQWFRALDLVPLEFVRVVILGQDPYHGEGQANGLSFSVSDGVKFPPSLMNIFKELKADIGVSLPNSGNLERWAKQGVLLLNAVLTVEAGMPASHQNRGWEGFTDKIISVLNDQQRPLVFMLWGNYAQKKASFVDQNRHLVLRSAHPSPLSAYNGFFGSKPFSKANTFLRQNKLPEIDWS